MVKSSVPAGCAAVVPCLNEGGRIAALVAALRRQLACVVVVDDGSSDGTAELAREAGATVLRHERNLGKGTALRTGLSHVRALGFEWAFTLDGDGQHSPDDFAAFGECAQQTGATLVVGNRMHAPEQMCWLRRHVNFWMSRQLSRRLGQPLPDTQCGFRLVHLQSWAALPLTTGHFEVESEMLLAFVMAGHHVAFVPIQVIGQSRRSHIHPVVDSVRWWRWWRGAAGRAAQSVPVAIGRARCPQRAADARAFPQDSSTFEHSRRAEDSAPHLQWTWAARPDVGSYGALRQR